MKQKPLKIIFEAIINGKYRFDEFLNDDISSLYETFFHKERKIYAPSKKLKSYQTFISLIILEHLPINTDVVFSYRKGTNVVDAVRPHQNSKYFYQTDLVSFFSSLDRNTVKNTLDNGSINCPAIDINEYKDRIIDIIVADNHLPQGFVTSPAMSNACLFGFDNFVSEHCKIKNLIYTRYSDDIIISSESRDEIGLSQLIVEEAILNSTINLRVNQRKSKLVNLGNRVTLLGVSILPNGRISVSPEIKNKIESLLYFFKSDREKFHNILGDNEEKAMSQLSGYINHINTVDPLYLDKLRKKYGTTIIDALIHQSKGL